MNEITKKPTFLDVTVSAVKVGATAYGAFFGPAGSIVSSLFNEVLTLAIPNQRFDRLVEFVETLNDKLSGIEEEFLKQRFQEPGFVDILEDGIHQAVRAQSNERMKAIASILKNGLSDEDTKAVGYKKLLSLLSELNDIEVIKLRFHFETLYGDAESFWVRHAEVFREPVAFVDSPEEDRNAEALYISYEMQLKRLGLLESRSTGSPSLDWSLALPPSDNEIVQISQLGTFLIRTIDDAFENEVDKEK